MKKKKQLNENEFRDLWLMKYHNTNCEEVVKKYPEEVKTPEWFQLYPCTQEQHDEWVIDAKQLLINEYKFTKHFLKQNWGYIYLQCSPYIEREEITD